MPRPELEPFIWVRLPKHRKATERNWTEAISRTLRGDSQYHPSLTTDEQEALERECVSEGEVYRDSQHIKKFYMKANRIVGACCGVHTEYVFAEWINHTVHGRPISAVRLREMGVNVDD